jgi:hypothetical protein
MNLGLLRDLNSTAFTVLNVKLSMFIIIIVQQSLVNYS